MSPNAPCFCIVLDSIHRSAQALCRERGVGSLTVCCAPCDEAMYQALGFNVPLGVSRSCLL